MQGINIQEKNIGETSDSLYLGFPFWPSLCYVPGDLQEELIYLKTKVFPHLDTLCQAKGSCFTPVDLTRNQQERRDDENNQSLIFMTSSSWKSVWILLTAHPFSSVFSDTAMDSVCQQNMDLNLISDRVLCLRWRGTCMSLQRLVTLGLWRMSIAPVALQSWRSPRQPSLTTTEAASSILKTALHRTQRTTQWNAISWTCCPLKAKVRDRDWEI